MKNIKRWCTSKTASCMVLLTAMGFMFFSGKGLILPGKSTEKTFKYQNTGDAGSLINKNEYGALNSKDLNDPLTDNEIINPFPGKISNRVTDPELEGDFSLYQKGNSLAETLESIRNAYTSWETRQKKTHSNLSKILIYSTEILDKDSDDAKAISGGMFDPSKNRKGGQKLWNPLEKWNPGVPYIPGGIRGKNKAAFMAANVQSNGNNNLSIGVYTYEGDEITIWCNGKQIFSKTNAFDFPDYWWGHEKRFVYENYRINQSIVDVPLQNGKNVIVLSVREDSDVPVKIYFTLNPEPLDLIWNRLREDFPDAREPFLDAVPAEWFLSGYGESWFSESSSKLNEKRFQKMLLEQTGLLPEVFPFREDIGYLLSLSQFAHILKMLTSIRMAGTELNRIYSERYPWDRILNISRELEMEALQLARSGNLQPGSAQSNDVLERLTSLRKSALVKQNPMLAGREILFSKHFTYASYHFYDEYNNSLGTRFGKSNISRLSLSDGAVRDLRPEMSDGLFDVFDLSWDAKRIVFGYQRPEPEGMRIYEMLIDGNNLRQLTFDPEDEQQRMARYCVQPLQNLARNFLGYSSGYGHWTDDMHPCYLPDGRVVFVSTRSERSVLCGMHTLSVTSLYRINGDGGDLHLLSQNPLHEYYPRVLNDGRIMYTRWEYVDKGVGGCQPLWTMRPSGEANEEIYGNNITDPGVFIYGRPVPGRNDLIVCTGAAHEMVAVGPVLLIDRNKDKRDPSAMLSVTPEVKVSGMRDRLFSRNGRWVHDIYGQVYCHPFPLADPETHNGGGSFFLVAGNKGGFLYDKTGFGLYLIDRFGNKVLIHEDPEVSCWNPVLLAPSEIPSVIPESPKVTESGDAYAIVFMSDVYRGLEEYGIQRGEVKYLRINEYIPRPWSAYNPWGGDTYGSQMAVVSKNTRLWVQVLNGIVPVNPDGSAYFTVPASKNIFFQALDKDFQEIQRMRTTLNFQAGERRSCIGCHESRAEAPSVNKILAMEQSPSHPKPQPGETAPRPVHYPTDVQPVLDRHCIQCHSGNDPKAGLNLTGTFTTLFNVSYENLIDKGLVEYVQEFGGPKKDGGAMSNIETKPPKAIGSHASKLIEVIRKGHQGIELSQNEWIRLVTWVDANCPYYGSYFGRRHIQYLDHPDFRPVPTLSSARGTEPGTNLITDVKP